MFTNLQTRYSRHQKKLIQAKVSGSGSDGVSKVKDEAGDLFPYLAWLNPFSKPRKTSSNFITVYSENEPTSQDDTSRDYYYTTTVCKKIPIFFITVLKLQI